MAVGDSGLVWVFTGYFYIPVVRSCIKDVRNMTTIRKSDITELKDWIEEIKTTTTKKCGMCNDQGLPICDNTATHRIKFGFSYGYVCDECKNGEFLL